MTQKPIAHFSQSNPSPLPVDDGWQLVPKFASAEMETAAVKKVRPYHDEDWYQVMPKDLFRLAWPALLAAAPCAPDTIGSHPCQSNTVVSQETVSVAVNEAMGTAGTVAQEPKRWLLEEELPGGSIRWHAYEYEHLCRTVAANSPHNVTVSPLYSAPPREPAPQVVEEPDWFETCLNIVHEHKRIYVVERDDLKMRGKANAHFYASLVNVCDSISQAMHDARAALASSQEKKFRFTIGDRVQKISGYKWPGIVVAQFKTIGGETRYVVECTVPEVSGALHIYSESQLALASKETTDV